VIQGQTAIRDGSVGTSARTNGRSIVIQGQTAIRDGSVGTSARTNGRSIVVQGQTDIRDGSAGTSARTKAQVVAENRELKVRIAEVETALAAAARKRRPRLAAGSSAGTGRVDERTDATIDYRRLFETARDGILILDGETGAVTDVNPSLEQLLRLPRARLLGKRPWEIAALQTIARSEATLEKLRTVEWTCYDSIEVGSPGGERRDVEFMSTLYMVDGVRVIQCRIRDITARQRAEVVHLRRANERLSSSVKTLQTRDDEMTAMRRLNDLLQSCETSDEAYRAIGAVADDLFGGHPGCLAMLQPSGRFLETVVRWGGENLVAETFPPHACWAMRHGRPHEVQVPGRSLNCGHFRSPPRQGFLCLPLTVQGTTIGVLHVGEDSTALGRSRHEHAVAVGETIKLFLANLRRRTDLLERATRDGLTGLFNRRYLDDTLPREIHSCLRRNAPLCVAMIDIDHFKQFNDRFGHDAGDRALRDSGRLLATNLRQGDIACRYGGEEFVIVMTDSSLVDTIVRLEQIRDRFEGLAHDGRLAGTLTLSAGVAAAPEHGSSAQELLRAADEALYAAKRVGRNRVVAYQPSA
jgi:diguanylate cyclase (GGDEF)-like protein/PAS domain S-box-containing protein